MVSHSVRLRELAKIREGGKHGSHLIGEWRGAVKREQVRERERKKKVAKYGNERFGKGGKSWWYNLFTSFINSSIIYFFCDFI